MFAEARFVAGEVDAMEACVVEWHRLLPVLLPPGNPDARLAPAAFFRPCAGAGLAGEHACASAAAVLLSYISYPYFDSSSRALVMRSMHCLAAAAAAVAPGAVFAMLLPQESPEAGVASAARGAIVAAFTPEAAAATPQLLAAACDALVTAVQGHPSLLDALLFPCGLEQALLDKVCGQLAPLAEGRRWHVPRDDGRQYGWRLRGGAVGTVGFISDASEEPLKWAQVPIPAAGK